VRRKLAEYPLPRPDWDQVSKAAQECRFWPSPELEEWARWAFIENGPLRNPDHEHLQMASIGFVWAGIDNRDKGRRVLGTAQMGDPGGKPWSRGQRFQQVSDWFNGVPDFVITLDASFFLDCDSVAACAIIEHELYHCGHAKDKFGSPKYDKASGCPVFWLRPHDVEEFAGVIRRYGAHNMDLADVQRAFAAGAELGQAHVDGVCGCGGGFGN
jgi:hypothetical protein